MDYAAETVIWKRAYSVCSCQVKPKIGRVVLGNNKLQADVPEENIVLWEN